MARWDPYQQARRLKIEVEHVDDELDGDLGRWYPHERKIELTTGLLHRTERSVLAHELAHAMLGHPAGDDPKRERQADRWAALRLIDHDELLEAEVASPDPGQWCVDLEVTPRLLHVAMHIYKGRHHGHHLQVHDRRRAAL
ncbi:ImmA/IrrE family metallo-endopeptidase [Pseudoclavibacter sp. 8L]|uniref:ImmA/IrrE family metallo-endopeptidase n=1 Tax=Pseudoclavibacter sp. 8L TaxID=2653162 RepID=UPI0012F0E746|nr:ImmA/IrrE family metallo-endopeptidase [Pseudoclavibacter sp. 8L]VXB76606.1 conserved hypothetical protein [Pseudoclavibacter sp. 8L]